MSNELSPTDRQPDAANPGPGFVPQAPPTGPADPYAPAPTGYGPPTSTSPQPGDPQPEQVPGQPVEQHWTAEGLVSTPALPPERVGHGSLLALLAVPVGVVLTAVIWKLGFIASISGIVVSAGATVLYARGSGGRVKKGIPVIALVIALGIVGSFFAAVLVDLYDVYPSLDPEIASTYASRGSFIANNIFYPPVLKEYTRTGVMLVLFGVLGAFGTILRLVRMNATLQR